MTEMAALLLRFVNIAFKVYIFILLIRVVFSWIKVNPYSKFYQFIFNMTEPLLLPIRRVFKPSAGLPVDFSPIILMLILFVLERVIYAIIQILV